MEDKELKEKLICAYKNSEVNYDSYNQEHIKGFYLSSKREDITSSKKVKYKKWFKTTEKIVTEKTGFIDKFYLHYKQLSVELTEEEYTDLKTHVKEKYKQQIIEDLTKLCK